MATRSEFEYEELLNNVAPKCCDCKRTYEPPVYYTLGADPDDPVSTGDEHDDGSVCTNNYCPDCAGPYLTPDDPNDPRRPTS